MATTTDKTGKSVQEDFLFQAGVNRMQHLPASLEPAQDDAPGGVGAIVAGEAVRFHVNDGARVDTRRKLLDECAPWCIVGWSGGVFCAADAERNA